MTAEDAAEIYARQGAEELIARLVSRFHTLERECDALLVLGSSFATDDLPASWPSTPASPPSSAPR
nr:hypothetical protein GCM10020093_055100 [Planobispora longispora]